MGIDKSASRVVQVNQLCGYFWAFSMMPSSLSLTDARLVVSRKGHWPPSNIYFHPNASLTFPSRLVDEFLNHFWFTCECKKEIFQIFILLLLLPLIHSTPAEECQELQHCSGLLSSAAQNEDHKPHVMPFALYYSDTRDTSSSQRGLLWATECN